MSDRRHLIAHLLLRKEAGAAKKMLSAVVGAGKGYMGIGKAISDQMGKAGVKSRLAHEGAKLLPVVGAAVGAKKAYDSETSQKLRYKARLWKQKRQMKKAMRAQRRGY